jgi:hypothetical protein
MGVPFDAGKNKAANDPLIAAIEAILSRYDPGSPPTRQVVTPGPQPGAPQTQANVEGELRQQWKDMPKGPERRAGVVSKEIDGKTYTYDRYGNALKQGFTPDRTKGVAYNKARFVGQAIFGGEDFQNKNIAGRQEDRQEWADEYKMAQDAAQQDYANEKSEWDYKSGQADRASRIFAALSPRMSSMSPEQREYYAAMAERIRADMEAGRTKAGANQKYGPDGQPIAGPLDPLDQQRLQKNFYDSEATLMELAGGLKAMAGKEGWPHNNEVTWEYLGVPRTVSEGGGAIKGLIPGFGKPEVNGFEQERAFIGEKFKEHYHTLRLAARQLGMEMPVLPPEIQQLVDEAEASYNTPQLTPGSTPQGGQTSGVVDPAGAETGQAGGEPDKGSVMNRAGKVIGGMLGLTPNAQAPAPAAPAPAAPLPDYQPGGIMQGGLQAVDPEMIEGSWDGPAGKNLNEAPSDMTPEDWEQIDDPRVRAWYEILEALELEGANIESAEVQKWAFDQVAEYFRSQGEE